MEKLLSQKIKLLISLLLFVSVISAGNIGGYGGAAMRAPLGAEAWGRGGASIANPGASYAYWNPALSSSLSAPHIAFGGFYRPLGRMEGYLSTEGKLFNSKMGISALFLYRGTPSIDSLRDANENLIAGTASYVNMTTKIGLSYGITQLLSIGFSMGWNYSKLPVNSDLDYSKSSSIGGVTIMGAYEPVKNLKFALGIKDLFMGDNWTTASSEFISTITDTLLSPIVLGASYSADISTMIFRFDGDLSNYLFNSYFTSIEHPFAYLNFGLSWQPYRVITFRAGIRDVLLSSSIFSDESYSLEAQTKLSGGISFIPTKKDNPITLKINYGFSNSGAGAGIDNVVDLVVQF